MLVQKAGAVASAVIPTLQQQSTPAQAANLLNPTVLAAVVSHLEAFDQIHGLSPLSAEAAFAVRSNLQETSQQMTCHQLQDHLINLQGQKSILDEVKLTGVPTQELIQSLSKHPEICKLDLSEAAGVGDEIVQAIAAHLKLTHLNLRGAENLLEASIQALSTMTSLESLTMDFMLHHVQMLVEHFPANPELPQSIRMHLNLCDGINPGDLQPSQVKALKNIHGLESLTTVIGYKVSNEDYYSHLAAIPGLKNLTLTCLPNDIGFSLSDVQAITQAQGLEGLTTLLYSDQLEESLAELAGMPNLKKLNVKFISRSREEETLSDQAVQNLANIPGLTSVGLLDSISITPDQLSTLVRLAPQLENLELYAPSDEHLERLSEASNLKELVLAKNSLVTEDGYAHIQQISNLKGIALIPSNLEVAPSHVVRALLTNVALHPNVTALRMNNFDSGDGQLWAQLGAATRLESLSLQGGDIRQAQFQENVVKLKRLNEFSMTGVQAHPSILNHMSTLPRLQKLVYGPQSLAQHTSEDQLLSTEHLKALKGHPSLNHLHIGGPRTSDITNPYDLLPLAQDLNLPKFYVETGWGTHDLSYQVRNDSLRSLRSSRLLREEGVRESKSNEP